MRIYFDNNATTAVDPAVLDALGASLRDVYGNASSVHKEGQAARRAIEGARESVASLIGATAREVVFTSGGTEANNAAIFGAPVGTTSGAIVTTLIEHPSVLEPIAELERRGHRVDRIAPARSGQVPVEAVIDAIRDDTKLVCVMLANNETGVIQPVEAIGRVCRERGVHFHVDAVQGAGKIDIDVEHIQCDTLALSAHKLHAPKGIGALYVRRGVMMSPYIFGGAQERRRRAGTENVPLATAFGVAASMAADPAPRERVRALREKFEHVIPSVVEGSGRAEGAPIVPPTPPDPSTPLGMTTINGVDVPRVPNTSNVTFRGADGEGIVIGLDLAGVAVSTGSACSSGRVEPSHVLLAMGLTPEEAKSTVRFSISRFTTDGEIESVLDVLRDVVPRCRKES